MNNTMLTLEKLQELVNGLNALIAKGLILEALDNYYAEDCIQQENEQEPTVGKAANKKREKKWIEGLIEFRSAVVKSVAVDAERQVTMVEWAFDFSHREQGEMVYTQVSVQRWEADKIAHERFYYG